MNSTEYEKYYDEMCLKHNNMLDFNFFEEDFSEISFLEKAIYYEDLSLLDNGNLSFNVNMRLKYNYTLLMIATFYSSEKFVNYLLEHGAEVDAISNNGSTALHYLCADIMIQNREGIFFSLVKNNANIELRNYDGLNPFLLAAGSNAVDFLELLIEYGVDINTTHDTYVNALYYAIIKDSYEATKFLFEKELYQSFNSEQNYEMLTFFIEKKDREIVKQILNKISFSQEDLNRTLSRAAISNNLGIVKELYYSGIDIKNNQQLILIAKAKNNEEMFQFFKEKGAPMECLKNDSKINKTIYSGLPKEQQTIKEFCDFQTTLNKYIVSFLKKNPNKKESDIYKNSRLISRQLFSNIRKRKGYKTKKDKIVVLAANMNLTYGELEELLESAGFALSVGNEVDVKIINAFKNNQYTYIEDLFL